MVSRTARPAAEPRASASAAACPTRAPMVDARPSSPSYRSAIASRSEEHTSELQSPCNLVCRLLLEKKNNRGVSYCRQALHGLDVPESSVFHSICFATHGMLLEHAPRGPHRAPAGRQADS